MAKTSRKIHSNLLTTLELYGEPVKFDCPNCYFDSTKMESSGVFKDTFTVPVEINGRVIEPREFLRGRCPVCRGSGKIEFETKWMLECYVMWNPRGDARGGMENTLVGVEGHNTALVKAEEGYFEHIRDSQYALIDGIRCVLLRPPELRRIGDELVTVHAYFRASEPGFNTSDR